PRPRPHRTPASRARVWFPRARVWFLPARVWFPRARVWFLRARVWFLPARVWFLPARVWLLPGRVRLRGRRRWLLVACPGRPGDPEAAVAGPRHHRPVAPAGGGQAGVAGLT